MTRYIVDFRWRRNPKDWWETNNPELDEGEPGLEEDTGNFKIGPGRWNDLPSYKPYSETSDQALFDHINSLTPHPVYDDGPSFELLYENAKV